jgi:hypothetical protein
LCELKRVLTLHDIVGPARAGNFMDYLGPLLPEPIFSTHFTNASTGSVDFGFRDPTKYQGPFTTVTVNNNSQIAPYTPGQWTIDGIQFGVNGQIFSTPSGAGDAVSVDMGKSTPRSWLPIKLC